MAAVPSAAHRLFADSTAAVCALAHDGRTWHRVELTVERSPLFAGLPPL
ncbi:hypothetical protein [Streptomyces sp. WAC 06783]|nr:hypothetical protein [Streptomyces sp. WAC 06783]